MGLRKEKDNVMNIEENIFIWLTFSVNQTFRSPIKQEKSIECAQADSCAVMGAISNTI